MLATTATTTSDSSHIKLRTHCTPSLSLSWSAGVAGTTPPGWTGVQGTARPHNVPINSLEAAPRRLGGRGGGRRHPRHHTLGHYTPPHTTLLLLLLLNIVLTSASMLARYCSTMCMNSRASKHHKSQRKDAPPPKKKGRVCPLVVPTQSDTMPTRLTSIHSTIGHFYSVEIK